ncbi:hypothetical protein EXIGLDRAFT_206946 [Exidia glandulosa HHB12029]|uniref:SH3 domain-containing protein n=1 Tax=Exidia glandulosa HHB12029 TaxID=1314781 RepID=A0A165EM12_EXIGL|nr:hypothetical protein EXIGLDRAFT_206946 [Exidia glandulosa HHB12029]
MEAVFPDLSFCFAAVLSSSTTTTTTSTADLTTARRRSIILMIAADSDEPVLKRLSVAHLPPSSSSPFPSPSSSFCPPPVPSNHEFANKQSWSVRRKSPTKSNDEQPVAQTSTVAAAMSPPSRIDTDAANSLLSPTMATSTSNTPTPTQGSALSPRNSGSFTPATPSSGIHSHRSSLSDIQASRVAPPSPAPSRRPSMRRSASRRSNKSSVSSIHTPSKRRSISRVVKIRDFAFGAQDPRHTGVGSDVNADTPSSRRNSGWGSAFRWSGIASKLPWNQRSSSPSPTQQPTQSDFDRNFSAEFDEPGHDDAEEEYEEYEEAEGELRPGWYRAMYGFEPEGTAEMALREDQHVRVLGRGGGVGWAVARVEGGEGCALVPESYLEWLAPFEPGEEEGYDDQPESSELTYASTPEPIQHAKVDSSPGGHTPTRATTPVASSAPG